MSIATLIALVAYHRYRASLCVIISHDESSLAPMAGIPMIVMCYHLSSFCNCFLRSTGGFEEPCGRGQGRWAPQGFQVVPAPVLLHFFHLWHSTMQSPDSLGPDWNPTITSALMCTLIRPQLRTKSPAASTCTSATCIPR